MAGDYYQAQGGLILEFLRQTVAEDLELIFLHDVPVFIICECA